VRQRVGGRPTRGGLPLPPTSARARINRVQSWDDASSRIPEAAESTVWCQRRRAVASSCKVFHRSSSVQRASVRLFETRDDVPFTLQVIPYLCSDACDYLLRRRIAKEFPEPRESFESMRVYTRSFRSFGVKPPRYLGILFPSTALTYGWRAGCQQRWMGHGMAVPFSPNAGSTMRNREPDFIGDARELLDSISRNTICSAPRAGELSSVVIGCGRFISVATVEESIQASMTRVGRSLAAVRDRGLRRQPVLPPIPARASTRAAERGHFAILPSPPFPSNQRRR